MESINKYLDYLDSTTTSFMLLRFKPKKEFVKLVGPEDLYDKFMKTKVGYIKTHKISDNPGIQKGKVYEGITSSFGEGFPVWITNPSKWFHTSIVESIDWENKTFKTNNSVYAFEFEELEYEDLANKLLNLGINSISKQYIEEHDR